MSSNVSHLDLLRLARELQAAALGRDLDAIHTELCSLRNALLRHIRDEEGLVLELSPAVAAAVQHGQQRLLREIDEVLAHAGESDEDCRCVSRASLLTRAIARQATLENRLTTAAEYGE